MKPVARPSRRRRPVHIADVRLYHRTAGFRVCAGGFHIRSGFRHLVETPTDDRAFGGPPLPKTADCRSCGEATPEGEASNVSGP